MALTQRHKIAAKFLHHTGRGRRQAGRLWLHGLEQAIGVGHQSGEGGVKFAGGVIGRKSRQGAISAGQAVEEPGLGSGEHGRLLHRERGLLSGNAEIIGGRQRCLSATSQDRSD